MWCVCVCVRVWLCMRVVRVRCEGGIWLVHGGVAGCVACVGAARGGALVMSITVTGPYLVSA